MANGAAGAAGAAVPVLVAMMLFTGACNTLLTKLQDNQCLSYKDGQCTKFFEQPVIQTLQMFVGESGCWLVVLGSVAFSRLRGHRTERSELDYQRLNDDEPTVDQDEEPSAVDHAPVQTLVDPTNIATKPLLDGEEVAERKPLKGWAILLLAAPSCCDIIATTLMNVGLIFLASSVYQMLRGMMVLFVGLLSVLFLRRRLGGWKWGSLVIVVLGIFIVGLAGVLAKKDGNSLPDNMPDKSDELLSRAIKLIRDDVSALEARTAGEAVIGIMLTVSAQIFGATQFVLEESIMERYSMEPIQVVGWEGVFGFVITLLGMGILHGAVGQTDAGRGGYFDAREAFHEVFTNRNVAITSVLIMISIGGFNFFGLSVTRQLSATARSTIDTCRTLIIWIVSLGLGWESFKWLQVLGFALLVYGTALFNDIVRPPTLAFIRGFRSRLIALDEED